MRVISASKEKERYVGWIYQTKKTGLSKWELSLRIFADMAYGTKGSITC